jgi:hypothetical protein
MDHAVAVAANYGEPVEAGHTRLIICTQRLQMVHFREMFP